MQYWKWINHNFVKHSLDSILVFAIDVLYFILKWIRYIWFHNWYAQEIYFTLPLHHLSTMISLCDHCQFSFFCILLWTKTDHFLFYWLNQLNFMFVVHHRDKNLLTNCSSNSYRVIWNLIEPHLWYFIKCIRGVGKNSERICEVYLNCKWSEPIWEC